MDVLKILRKVGNVALSAVVPGYSQVVGVINEFLPKDKQVSGSSTGTEIEEAIKTLPPDKQAEVLSKKLDVEIAEITEHTKVITALAEVDKAGASTRPKIAMLMAYFFIGVGALFTVVICGAIIWASADTLKNIKTFWPLVLSILGPPIALLERYFGKRTKEKQARYAGAFGAPLQGGFLSTILSAIKR